MGYNRGRSRDPRYATARARLGLSVLLRGAVALVAANAVQSVANAQQVASAAAPLVLDGVTVVDVEHGKLLPKQRVIIAGNRIQTLGNLSAVKIATGAQVVDARGKYLIPGLWELHIHPMDGVDLVYPLLIATGVTGIRDAWSEVPLATQIQRRREILAGTRVGPPRQILSGPAIDESESCTRADLTGHICVASGDSADARRLVEELKAAGADMLKMYKLSRPTYFLVAAAARRAGLPFGGHLMPNGPTVIEASDSGAGIIDHPSSNGGLDTLCLERGATVERCRSVVERFRHNGTWLVPTLIPFNHPYNGNNPASRYLSERFNTYIGKLWSDSAFIGGLRNYLYGDSVAADFPDSLHLLHIARQVGLPILAGTDAVTWFLKTMAPGFSLHTELAMYVAEGLTPLEALQTATLNPAKLLHATDSLGTVAPGKLADLVLLDANPLADITNTTTVRAVVADGRYFDRAALDQLLAEVQTKVKQEP